MMDILSACFGKLYYLLGEEKTRRLTIFHGQHSLGNLYTGGFCLRPRRAFIIVRTRSERRCGKEWMTTSLSGIAGGNYYSSDDDGGEYLSLTLTGHMTQFGGYSIIQGEFLTFKSILTK